MTASCARTLRALVLSTLTTSAALADAAPAVSSTYRCDDHGRITYADQPCTAGVQTGVVDRVATPTAQDRLAAEARHRAEQARLAALEDSREAERRQDERAAALAARRNVSRGREAAACNKLALRAKRAHEDFDRSAPRDQTAKRTRMHRDDDDYAALCKNR